VFANSVTVKHGTHAYRSKKCRCKVCKEAYAESNKRHAERRRESNPVLKLPYDTFTRSELLRLREDM